MNKKMLQIGQVVELRNGNRALVSSTNQNVSFSLLFPSDGIIDMDMENLNFQNLLSEIKSDYDIMKIYDTIKPIRRLSEIKDQDNLTLLINRDSQIILRKFDAMEFDNASNDVKKSYSGLTNLEAFRNEKHFFQIDMPDAELEDKDAYNFITKEKIEKAKSLCIQEVMDVINLKIELEDSNISPIVFIESEQFKYGLMLSLKIDKEKNPDLISDSGCNAFVLALKMNDRRIESLLKNRLEILN
jgi:hypothetical protein